MLIPVRLLPYPTRQQAVAAILRVATCLVEWRCGEQRVARARVRRPPAADVWHCTAACVWHTANSLTCFCQLLLSGSPVAVWRLHARLCARTPPHAQPPRVNAGGCDYKPRRLPAQLECTLCCRSADFFQALLCRRSGRPQPPVWMARAHRRRTCMCVACGHVALWLVVHLTHLVLALQHATAVSGLRHTHTTHTAHALQGRQRAAWGWVVVAIWYSRARCGTCVCAPRAAWPHNATTVCMSGPHLLHAPTYT